MQSASRAIGHLPLATCPLPLKEPCVTEPNPNARPPQVFDLAFLTGVPNVTEVLLIRHGQQEADFQGPIGGTVDPPLSERGLMQAELLGRWLSIRPIAAIYASNLRRAQQTA